MHDVILALFTIVYGLMLTDLFSSFHRLIRNYRKVRWHWLSLLSSWYLFLIILKNWWDLAFMKSGSDQMSILLFLVYGHLLFIIFLLVSTALPDEIGDGVNLKDYYFGNHRYFWGLMSAVALVSGTINVVKILLKGNPVLFPVIGSGVFLALTFILAVSKRRWVHSAILVLMVLTMFLEIVGKMSG